MKHSYSQNVYKGNSQNEYIYQVSFGFNMIYLPRKYTDHTEIKYK